MDISPLENERSKDTRSSVVSFVKYSDWLKGVPGNMVDNDQNTPNFEFILIRLWKSSWRQPFSFKTGFFHCSKWPKRNWPGFISSKLNFENLVRSDLVIFEYLPNWSWVVSYLKRFESFRDLFEWFWLSILSFGRSIKMVYFEKMVIPKVWFGNIIWLGKIINNLETSRRAWKHHYSLRNLNMNLKLLS